MPDPNDPLGFRLRDYAPPAWRVESIELSFELGIDTESWCAEFALRRRVSMSATGSVIVMCCFFLS